MKSKEISFLNEYFGIVEHILLPRVLEIFDSYTTTVKKAIVGGIKAPIISVTTTTKRLTAVIVASYKISKENIHSMVVMRVSQIRDSMIELIQCMANNIIQEEHKLVFLLNNMDYICGKCKAIKRSSSQYSFIKQCKELQEKYINSILVDHFKVLIGIVKKCTTENVDCCSKDYLKKDVINKISKEYLEKIGNEFSEIWKDNVSKIQKKINNELYSKFLIKESLKSILKAIIDSYLAFTEIVRYKHENYFRQLTTQHVLIDLKNTLRHAS